MPHVRGAACHWHACSVVFELLLQVSQSRCDVVRIGRQHVRNGKLALKRQKTGVPFEVPVMEALQSAIDAMSAGDHLTFLVTAHGSPSALPALATGSGTSATRPACRSAARRMDCGNSAAYLSLSCPARALLVEVTPAHRRAIRKRTNMVAALQRQLRTGAS
jgi:hypothetical protein